MSSPSGNPVPGRRLRCALLSIAFIMAGLPARAAEWPDRPIRLVVPSTPGSTPDIFARILGEGLRNRLKQPIVVENRPGAGGSIAVNTVARAEPSGYVIGITPPGPVVLNKLLYEKPSYDAAKDLSLISIAVRQPNVLVVRSSLGVDSLEGLLQRLHTEPNRFNYAMIGIGSINHLCMESVALKSGTEIAPITYNGTAQAVIALLAGEVDMACLPAQAVVQQVNAGKIRALAVATEDRSRFFPSVPSLKEAGIIGVDASAWMGIIAPASLPAPIVARLSKDIAAVLQAPDIRARLATQYMEVVASTPDQFATTVRDDSARWKPVIESRKIRLK